MELIHAYHMTYCQNFDFIVFSLFHTLVTFTLFLLATGIEKLGVMLQNKKWIIHSFIFFVHNQMSLRK